MGRKRVLKNNRYIFLFTIGVLTVIHLTIAKLPTNSPHCISLSARNAGMFSMCNDVLDLLKGYEFKRFKGIEVNFDDTGLYYSPSFGKNWWNYYFEPIALGSQEVTKIKTQGGYPRIVAWQNETEENRKEAFRLIQQYIRVKPHILNKIDAFEKTYFKDCFIVGVHYRATDKLISEARFVAYEDITQAIKTIIKAENCESKNYKIFVATDDQNFLDYMVHIFGTLVCYNPDVIRSKNNQPLHYAPDRNPYKCGEDALVDCLLLSKTNFLLKTISSLSRWSIFFNPTLSYKTIT